MSKKQKSKLDSKIQNKNDDEDKILSKLKSDKRFSSITMDPKFMTAPKSVTKVKIDKRFNKMIKDKNFMTGQMKDKFGKFDIKIGLTVYLEEVYEFDDENEPEIENEDKVRT